MRSFINIIILLLASPSLFGTDSTLVKPGRQKKKSYAGSMLIPGGQHEIFVFMDNIENTGSHMTKSNAQMMGSKLALHWLTPHHTGPGTSYRWTGRTMCMKMDFTVQVSDWNEDKRKVWGTVGKAKMIVISWFEMYLDLSPGEKGHTCTRLRIHYTRSKNLAGLLFGRAYSKWCVNSMLRDTRKYFEQKKKQENKDSVTVSKNGR
jgi:hypothetical protein